MTPKMIPMMEKVNKADFFILGYLNWGLSTGSIFFLEKGEIIKNQVL